MKITSARVIVCSPGRNFVTLKIETDQGLTGIGDATLNGREMAVVGYLREHVVPLLLGRDAHAIEDTWQFLYRSAYWRRGPVTMAAIASVDTTGQLAEVLGAFVGQVTEDPIKEVEILFDGSTATMNTRALISAALAGLIRPQVADVNMVSAPIMVKERGIIVAEVKRDKSGVFDGYIKLTVKTEHMTR